MSVCAYCGTRRAVQTDHLITRNQARRSVKAAANRNNADFKVPCCRACNEAKATRLRVPPTKARLIPLLQSVTGGVYAVWDGTPEGLREVVK